MFTDITESKHDTFSYIELGFLYISLLLPYFANNYVTRLIQILNKIASSQKLLLSAFYHFPSISSKRFQQELVMYREMRMTVSILLN